MNKKIYLETDGYIKTNAKSLPDKVLLDYLQHSLHAALQSFLNGGFSGLGFIFYPLRKSVSRKNVQAMSKALMAANELAARGYELRRTSSVLRQDLHNPMPFANALCTAYQEIKALPMPKAIIRMKKVFPSLKDTSFLAPVRMLSSFLEGNASDLIQGCYLHGSLASNDYVKGYSDVETLIVLDDKALESPESIVRLRDTLYQSRRYFFQIDPLQHHGHYILTEFDLRYYPESFLPVAALKHAKRLFGRHSLGFSIRSGRIEHVQHFLYFHQYFRSMPRCLTLYEKKFFLHGAALVPSLFLESMGKVCSKKDSFTAIRKYFSEDELKPIREVESIRRHWKACPPTKLISHVAKHNPVPVYLTYSLWLGMINDPLGRSSFHRLRKDMKLFVENAYRKVVRQLR